jgi:hypothetical protein
VVAPTNIVDYSPQVEYPDLCTSTSELTENMSESSESLEHAVSVSMEMERGGCKDIQPTKVKVKSRVFLGDEWGFCGPECFCWIVDIASSG